MVGRDAAAAVCRLHCIFSICCRVEAATCSMALHCEERQTEQKIVGRWWLAACLGEGGWEYGDSDVKLKPESPSWISIDQHSRPSTSTYGWCLIRELLRRYVRGYVRCIGNSLPSIVLAARISWCRQTRYNSFTLQKMTRTYASLDPIQLVVDQSIDDRSPTNDSSLHPSYRSMDRASCTSNRNRSSTTMRVP